MTNPYPPPAAQWAPTPVVGGRASNAGLIIALGAVGLIAVAALVVGIVNLTRPTSNDVGKLPTNASPSPTFTPDQVANAEKELCSAYRLAARSVNADTHSSNTALARVSLVNGAAMLEAAAANPALSPNERDAARELASAYRTSNAVSSVTDAASPEYQRTIDDVNRLDDAMAAICR
ncbi:hypothetical protein [Mycobacterium palustre]|uniref:hypothetical protein n=1 Tax=Mycobacterium palustre TaxID=153971 RepID=UPI0011542E1B|nr:hypothetical protein [Mycobacterium palustre]MCV7103207.1 hypothetical protein [Mycobacterium palustre]